MVYSKGEDCSMEVAASCSKQPLDGAFPNYGCDIIKLQAWKTMKLHLKERAMRFLNHPELQYVAMENVSASDIVHIDDLRRCGDLPEMKVLYDKEKRLMIVKLMPIPHEVASMIFHDFFHEMVPASTGIVALGSTRFGKASRRHKEPDQAYLQQSTRTPNPAWPSVVLEVGVSESLQQLREDAWYWLMSSNGMVFVVIIISISLTTGNARWERWEHVPYDGPVTQMQNPIQPTLMQFVTIPRYGPIRGAPFRIPSNKIWDIVPNDVEDEIVFTKEYLVSFSRRLMRFY